MHLRTAVMLCAFGLPVATWSAAADIQGDPARGRQAFTELKCSNCHSVAGEGGKAAPDLGRRGDASYTPVALASTMWNHVTTMWQAMDRAGVRRPEITDAQAADLFAYFAGQHRAEKPGDAVRGRAVYESKFCARCHDDPYSGSPSLAPIAGRADAYALIAGLWRHGGGMLSRMVARNTQWQTLSPDEMRNLIAYLRTRQEPPAGRDR